MEVSVNKKENSVIELEVKVPAEKVEESYNAIYSKIQKNAKLDGFRQGKAPIDIVKQKFQEQADQQVVEEVIKASYFDALKDNNLYPINHPQFDFDKVVKGEEFTFKAIFEVHPTVELGEYKNISADEKACKISDKDVEAEIDGLRERNAAVSSKEDGAKAEKGDLVKLTAERTDSEKDDATGRPFDLSVVAGQRKDDHEFDKYVIGMGVDEEKEISFKYPKDYHVSELCGKKVSYKIKVTQINLRTLPELDDEFAKDHEYDSLDDMKNKIKERLVSYTEERAKGDSKAKVLDTIINSSKFDIPNSMIEQEKMQIFQRMQQRMGVQVPEIGKFAKTFGMDEEEFTNKMRDEAIQSIKSTLTLAEISKVEELKVTDEKFESAVKDMAERSQKPVEEIKSYIEQNNVRGNIESQLMFDIAMDYIYENAKIKKLSPVAFKDFVKG